MNTAELDELIDTELEQAVVKLERQLELAASRRARVEAAVFQDIERRLEVIEKNAAAGLAQQQPRARRQQRAQEARLDKVASMYARADALEHTDKSLAAGMRELAAEAAEKELQERR
jgi:hypothetical protein